MRNRGEILGADSKAGEPLRSKQCGPSHPQVLRIWSVWVGALGIRRRLRLLLLLLRPRRGRRRRWPSERLLAGLQVGA